MISFSSDGEACKNLLNVGLSHHLNFWDRNGEVLLGFVTLRTKKSYTCEEGGAHLRIFLWHLLMNLKNKCLFKKLLKWANEKCKNFNIYNVVFFKKKIKKIIRRYHYFTAVYQKAWWYVLQFPVYRVWQTKMVIMGHFLSLYTPLLKIKKIKKKTIFFGKMKKNW